MVTWQVGHHTYENGRCPTKKLLADLGDDMARNGMVQWMSAVNQYPWNPDDPVALFIVASTLDPDKIIIPMEMPFTGDVVGDISKHLKGKHDQKTHGHSGPSAAWSSYEDQFQRMHYTANVDGVPVRLVVEMGSGKKVNQKAIEAAQADMEFMVRTVPPPKGSKRPLGKQEQDALQSVGIDPKTYDPNEVKVHIYDMGRGVEGECILGQPSTMALHSKFFGQKAAEWDSYRRTAMFHEYGHALDRTPDGHNQKLYDRAVRLKGVQGGRYEYARTSPSEMRAVAFEEFMDSKYYGSKMGPLSQWYSKQEGWS